MIHPIEETGISNQSHTVPPKVSSTTGIPNPSLSWKTWRTFQGRLTKFQSSTPNSSSKVHSLAASSAACTSLQVQSDTLRLRRFFQQLDQDHFLADFLGKYSQYYSNTTPPNILTHSPSPNFRIVKNTGTRYAFMGGVVFCAYRGIIDYMRHHEEADPRPAFVDHVISTTLVSTGVSLFYATRPWQVFCTAFFSTVLVAPFMWWLKK